MRREERRRKSDLYSIRRERRTAALRQGSGGREFRISDEGHMMWRAISRIDPNKAFTPEKAEEILSRR